MSIFGNNKSPAKTVKLVKDSSGASAVSLDKIGQVSPSLRKKAEAVGVSLQKRNIAGIRAQVVVVLDHSGSMGSDYRSGRVQDLVERFLAFGLQIDVDGEIPVIPFDSRVKPSVDVTLSNYSNIVADKIYQPYNMGSTDLTSALEEVRNIAKETDAPLFVAVITDGEPNDRRSAEEIVCDLARYPVFVKFLALQKVSFLEELDDLGDDKRLLDNVDTKEYINLSSVTDEQFAEDMADEWDSWTTAAKAAGILED